MPPRQWLQHLTEGRWPCLEAHVALVVAALGSFVGATVANILFTGFAPLLAGVALSFGNQRYLHLCYLRLQLYWTGR